MVDKSSDFTRSAKLALERTGPYFVCEENDATKAHQSARNFKPDLILLDIVMPEMDGGEIATQIGTSFRLVSIPADGLQRRQTEACGGVVSRPETHRGDYD